MRFSSIKLSNYRQYQDVEFAFDKTTDSDIHIVIASNGVGKTNLLNAINWCLYGDEPHASGTIGATDNKSDKLSLCNIDALDRAQKEDESCCEVKVEIEMTDNNDRYTFVRQVEISTATYSQVGKDNFTVSHVSESGDTKIYEFEMAEEIVNKYLPKKIREYFYFDGEQLLNYFDSDSSNVSHIRDSIYEIAQVNVVKDVEKHLDDFVKKYQKELSKLSPNLEEKTNRLNELEEKIENKKIEISELEDQINNSEQAISKADQIINGTEKTIEDNQRYNKNLEEITRYEKKLKDAKMELVMFVRKYIILISLRNANKRTEEYILQRAGDGTLVPDINIDVIKDSLEEHKCRICGSELNQSAEEYLQSLVDKFVSNASIQKMTEIRNDVHRGLDISNYEIDKEKCFGNINEYQNKINELIEENEGLYKRISSVTAIEEIETAMEKKKANSALIKINSQKIGSYREHLKELNRQLEQARKEYDQAVSDNKDCDNLKKKLDFVLSAKGIVFNIQEEIVSDVKVQMQKLTMELFEQLVWKKETYGRIELDDNFRLKLFHKKTGLSCLNSCSAAEKELLALAFTIAIHKVSGYNNLLFIDTPVGRVSDTNRENFAKVLLEVSKSKQIILAFTPSEYSDEIKSVLNDLVISSSNKLSTNEVETVKEA